MKAAVVESHGRPPSYRDFDEPAARAGEVIVSVRAAALSQLVRAQAAGTHYASPKPPFVPGADGVGRLADGRRVYFAFPRPPIGAMAERVAVNSAYVVALPDDIDDVAAAALANPAMSSWAALTERASLKPGETVLINGATGASGRLAIRIAKHLGAGRVVATGRSRRSEAELLALGADAFMPLEEAPETLAERFRQEIARGVDVVLDYLWGASAEAFLGAATTHAEGKAARRIRFVNIGSVSGAKIALPASALRSSGLELLGSGLGSVSNEALMTSIGAAMRASRAAGLRVEARAAPLTLVETAWTDAGAERIVFTVGP
jgi:NADPH:quinone reductase-like Zn-dependent oxidoreductase